MNLDKLNKLYDTNIRKHCNKYETNLIRCLDDSFNDNFVCAIQQDLFNKCISNFDKKFREKYLIKKN